MDHGYKTILQKGHPHSNSAGYVLEHIIIAERKLGRLLKEGETVHHIDRNKKNNNPDNLMIFASPGDHTLYHAGEKIYKDGDVWRAFRQFEDCPVCGNKFIVTSQKRKYKKHFCSIECKMKAETKVEDVQTIIALLNQENGNFTKVSKLLNVSDNALKHRLKNAGLPFHSKDYKRKS